MRVSELMSRDVITIGDTETWHEAVEQMCRRKVRHLPVVDREGALVGLVTDRDVRHRLFAPDVYRQIGEVPVSTLLRQAPIRGVMSTRFDAAAPRPMWRTPPSGCGETRWDASQSSRARASSVCSPRSTWFAASSGPKRRGVPSWTS
jgi:CBS domain-containing protein